MMPPIIRLSVLVAVLAVLVGPGGPTAAADWPQFQRQAERTGDAADESLTFPLGLATCVRLVGYEKLASA